MNKKSKKAEKEKIQSWIEEGKAWLDRIEQASADKSIPAIKNVREKGQEFLTAVANLIQD